VILANLLLLPCQQQTSQESHKTSQFSASQLAVIDSLSGEDNDEIGKENELIRHSEWIFCNKAKGIWQLIIGNLVFY